MSLDMLWNRIDVIGDGIMLVLDRFRDRIVMIWGWDVHDVGYGFGSDDCCLG